MNIFCCEYRQRQEREFNITDSWDVFLRHVEWMTRIFVIPNFLTFQILFFAKMRKYFAIFCVLDKHTWEAAGAEKNQSKYSTLSCYAWLLTDTGCIQFSQLNTTKLIQSARIILFLHPAARPALDTLTTWSSCYDWMVAQSVMGHDLRSPDINNQIITSISIYYFLLLPIHLDMIQENKIRKKSTLWGF